MLKIFTVDLNDLAHYNGGILVLIVTCITLSITSFFWLERELKSNELKLSNMLTRNRTRITLAWVIVSLAIGIGAAMRWPLVSLIIATERHRKECNNLDSNDALLFECLRVLNHSYMELSRYTDFFVLPVNISNLLISLGLIMFLWIVIRDILGKWSFPVMISSAVFVYYIGALLTEYLAEFY